MVSAPPLAPTLNRAQCVLFYFLLMYLYFSLNTSPVTQIRKLPEILPYSVIHTRLLRGK